MPEFTREIPYSDFQLEVDDKTGVFTIYDGPSRYMEFSADNALEVLKFLEKYRPVFEQAIKNSVEEPD